MSRAFGWCLDGLHYACRVVTVDGHPCARPCHAAVDEWLHNGADECADERAAAHEADLRTYGVEL